MPFTDGMVSINKLTLNNTSDLGTIRGGIAKRKSLPTTLIGWNEAVPYRDTWRRAQACMYGV